jgi:hypothetical protein
VSRSFFCDDDINFGRAAKTGFFPSDEVGENDPRTGRPWGDHGTTQQALEFALDYIDDPYDTIQFLKDWREAELDEWPEFYAWLSD